MAYYCANCKRDHPGWPEVEFQFPEEYLQLTDQERELRCFLHNEGLKIEHKAHTHHYTQIFWSQKVQNSLEPWEFKIWVMVPSFEMLNELKNGELDFIPASLQSSFPWYSDVFLGFPILIKYDQKIKMLVVEEIQIKKSTLYKDYKNGLPYNVAADWCIQIVNHGRWSCINGRE